MPPTTEPDKAHASHPPNGATASAAPNLNVASDITSLRRSVDNLREAGLDDAAIAAIAELDSRR